MKKVFSLMLTAVLVFSLAACGKEDTVDVYEQTYGSSGTIIDTGVIKAVCPDSWTSVDVMDLESTDDKAMTNALEFIKGGTSASEDKPYIKIIYYEKAEDASFPSSGDYPNSAAMGTVWTGEYTWNGFTAAVNGYDFACMEADTENGTFVAYLWMHTGAEVQSSVNDDDVKLILQSLAVDE